MNSEDRRHFSDPRCRLPLPRPIVADQVVPRTARPATIHDQSPRNLNPKRCLSVGNVPPRFLYPRSIHVDPHLARVSAASSAAHVPFATKERFICRWVTVHLVTSRSVCRVQVRRCVKHIQGPASAVPVEVMQSATTVDPKIPTTLTMTTFWRISNEPVIAMTTSDSNHNKATNTHARILPFFDAPTPPQWRPSPP
jgi:hypothetical protein